MELKEEIDKAAAALRDGKVILYPTDTIWGLGCDPSNDEAVRKIYRIKKREDHKALIILIGEAGQLYNYVEKIPEIAWDLVEFAENPLTVIYPKGKNVSPGLLGEDGSLAVRLVKDDFCQRLMQRFKRGIVSTSANISGEPSPGNFTEISKDLLKEVDHVVNFRHEEKKISKPSTVIKLELNGEIKFIRK